MPLSFTRSAIPALFFAAVLALPQDGAAISIDTSATYTLVGVQSGKCVDVPNGSTASGVQLDMMPCVTAAKQQFKLADQGGGYYQIRNVGSSLCLDVKGIPARTARLSSNTPVARGRTSNGPSPTRAARKT